LARSDSRLARAARALYRGGSRVSLPAPKLLALPYLWTFLACRSVLHFLLRMFLCEPLLKAYCHRYGRGVHTDIYVPWVQGRGQLILGDNVVLRSAPGLCRR
jgi:hypothetical protein